MAAIAQAIPLVVRQAEWQTCTITTSVSAASAKMIANTMFCLKRRRTADSSSLILRSKAARVPASLGPAAASEVSATSRLLLSVTTSLLRMVKTDLTRVRLAARKATGRRFGAGVTGRCE